MPLITYEESEMTVTAQGSRNARSPWMAAIISMRLLVAFGWYPKISLCFLPKRRMQAQPPGPGLAMHDPSVIKVISFIFCCTLGSLQNLADDAAISKGARVIL